MIKAWAWLQSHLTNDEGASMVEYALLVVLIALVALIAIQFAGGEVSQTFSEIGTELDS